MADISTSGSVAWSNSFGMDQVADNNDVEMHFAAHTNDGQFDWMEDENYFKFHDPILMNSSGPIYFSALGNYIHSPATGKVEIGSSLDNDLTSMNLKSDGGLTFNVATDGVAEANDYFSFKTQNTEVMQIGSGGAVVMNSNLTIGNNSENDFTITFDGGTSNGVLTWMEDEDHLKFSDDAVMDAAMKLYFHDEGGEYIHASADGTLEIDAGTTLDINAPTVTIGASSGNQLLNIASHDLVDGGLKLAGTLVTSSAAELNLLDNVTGLVQADLTKLAAVDATAAELNLMDAGTSQGSVTLAGTDGFIINDADDVMKQALISDIPTFVASQTLTGVKIADNGNIGSASATTAITIAGSGAVTLAQRDIHSAGITLGEGTEIGVAANLDLMTLTSGGVAFTGNITTELALVVTSDARYKKNITPVSDAQDKLSELNPVNYEMRRNEFSSKDFNDRKQWGFIAQEVEKIMPELIRADKDGYRSMNYTGIIPLLTKAMQEQQTEMEKQQKEIDQLKAQLQSIMKMLDNDMSDKTDDKKADDNKKPVKLSMATVK